jgi:hypothetical protein
MWCPAFLFVAVPVPGRWAPKYYTTARRKNQFAKCTNFTAKKDSRFVYFDENFFQKMLDKY